MHAVLGCRDQVSLLGRERVSCGTKCGRLGNARGNTNYGGSDGNIRYFEYSNDEFIFLSEYKSGDPQRGIAFLPKRGVAVSRFVFLGLGRFLRNWQIHILIVADPRERGYARIQDGQ